MAEGIKLPSASGTQDGLVTTGTQTLGGQKVLSQGVTTTDATNANVTVASGDTLQHPYLTVGNGITYTVTGRMIVLDTLTISGTGSVVVSGTSVVQNLT